MSRDEAIRLLVERFRHRPRFLSVEKTVDVIRKLIRHAVPAEGGCIHWGGALNNSHYGKLNLWLHGSRHQFYVHRLSERLANDPSDVPPWMEVAHEVCDCPMCFNPDHVERQRRQANRAKAGLNTQAKRRARRAAGMEEVRC